MKLEPLSDEEIKPWSAICWPTPRGPYDELILRLILTIAHERAEYKWHHAQKFTDVLRTELKAFGWPEKELP